jgi:SAM-dependent methyltransferase
LAGETTVQEKLLPGETRTFEQLREQYEIEKELANRIRQSPRGERAALYAEVYGELFRRVPHHPQWTKQNTSRRERAVAEQMAVLAPYLKSGLTFLEAGAGDCAVSLRAAQIVRQVYAVEVSGDLLGRAPAPENFRLVLTQGCDIALPDDSVDLVYSYQLMEHIHPEDALDQLAEIKRILRPGGRYLCVTPNRLSGPHDISWYFDDAATGLHLKEYSIGDLASLFRKAGFRRVEVDRRFRSRRFRLPVAPLALLERGIEALPRTFRRRLVQSRAVAFLLNVSVLATK